MFTGVVAHVVGGFENEFIVGFYQDFLFVRRVDILSCGYILDVEPSEVWDGNLLISLCEIVGNGAQHSVDAVGACAFDTCSEEATASVSCVLFMLICFYVVQR